jgi:hypothetical protein
MSRRVSKAVNVFLLVAYGLACAGFVAAVANYASHDFFRMLTPSSSWDGVPPSP